MFFPSMDFIAIYFIKFSRHIKKKFILLILKTVKSFYERIGLDACKKKG